MGSVRSLTIPSVSVAMVLTAGPQLLQAQETFPPGPRPSDWETPDAIITALYDVISIEAGDKIDWARDDALYIDGVRQVAMSTRPDGQVVINNMSVADFQVQSGAWIEENGFVEYEIGRHSDRYGNVMQVFSAYEGKQGADGPVITRGINSITLVHDGDRWWVAAIVWDRETPDNPVPDEYLFEVESD
ncbi:MAG: hypothetical protein V3U67_04155 [Gemmatimonadota bacterium]